MSDFSTSSDNLSDSCSCETLSEPELDCDSNASSKQRTPVKHIVSFRSNSRAGLFNIGSINFVWCSEYVRDILATLRDTEKRRKRNTFKSPQTQFRPSLVGLIKSASETQYLCRSTVHLAVYLLDIFMDSYKIVPNKLNLVALVCVLLAAKMEERDHSIPKMMRLNSLVKNQYTKQEFKNVEIKILCNLNWNLLCPTAATYVECFAGRVVSLEDFSSFNKDDSTITRKNRFKSYSHLFTTLNSLIFEFLDLSLKDIRIMHLEPSILAASCLAAARKLCDMDPLWPRRLRILTGYEIDTLEECVSTLLVFREGQLTKKSNTPDSGFLSDSDSSEDYIEDSRPRKRRRLSA